MPSYVTNLSTCNFSILGESWNQSVTDDQETTAFFNLLILFVINVPLKCTKGIFCNSFNTSIHTENWYFTHLVGSQEVPLNFSVIRKQVFVDKIVRQKALKGKRVLQFLKLQMYLAVFSTFVVQKKKKEKKKLHKRCSFFPPVRANSPHQPQSPVVFHLFFLCITLHIRIFKGNDIQSNVTLLLLQQMLETIIL